MTENTPILWTDSYGDEHELLPVGTEVTYVGLEDHHSDLDNETAVITGHDLNDTTPYEIRFTNIERMASPEMIWKAPATPAPSDSATAGAETTGAVERAGRAIWEHDNGHTAWPPRDPMEIGPAEDAGRAALAAALSDPDDALAQAMNIADGRFQGRVSPSWEALSAAGKRFYRFQVAAIRTHMLGGEGA